MTGEYYVAIDEREKLNEGLIANGTFTVDKEMLVLEFSAEAGRDPRALVINNRNDFQWIDLVRLRHIRNIPLSELLHPQVPKAAAHVATAKTGNQVTQQVKPVPVKANGKQVPKQVTPEAKIAEVAPTA